MFATGTLLQQQAPTTAFPRQVSKPNYCHRRRLRGARQPGAIACGRVWLPDTASSDTCKCCIVLACTHLLGSCHQQRQDKEMRRVRAQCTNCEICAGNRCLVCTLAYVGILLLSSSLYALGLQTGARRGCRRVCAARDWWTEAYHRHASDTGCARRGWGCRRVRAALGLQTEA